MPDFLLELFSEEIPARMQPAAARQLGERFEALLAEAGLSADAVETHATPRRLALIASGIPAASAATSEDRRGPRADAPAQAIEGFLKSTGLSRDRLEERDTGKGVFLFANLSREGRSTADILAEKLPALIGGFQWPKSQRWGPASVSPASPRWVRPLRGIVALLDTEVVPFEAMGLASGRSTRGHRFMGPKAAISIHSPGAYAGQLLAAHVVLSAGERCAIIREGAERAASEAGLKLRPDEGLEAENAGLTEWPVPLLGRFDPAYLDVPPEIIQLTMRTNQKYFAVEDAGGKLAPGFVCVANLVAADNGATIIGGNQRVLSARLADARFFWEQDKKVPLETRAEALKSIVFHEKLGTMAEKVERVAKLARWLVESGAIPNPHAQVIPAKVGVQPDRAAKPDSGAWMPASAGMTDSGASDAARTTVTPAKAGVSPPDVPNPASGEIPAFAGMTDEEFLRQVTRAAELCKADLTTGTVGEFPELQGIIGGYLAEAQGEKPGVVSALKQHYAPVPEGAVAVAVALADRLDSLATFFREGIRPTGSKDPFALRRTALGALSLILSSNIRLQLWPILAGQQSLGDGSAAMVDVVRRNFWTQTQSELRQRYAWHIGPDKRERYPPLLEQLPHITDDLLAFIAERLKVQQREAGVRHDLIDAVFALGGEDDLVRLLARVKALQAFVETDDGANLLAGHKRAANILRIEEKKD
ncbi:MAG: glycine--tRNA ligase subunit beta, partial [Sandaracinobacteroides sp.]